MSPAAILGVLLAASVALNGWQYRQALGNAVKYGTTQQLAEDTKAAAGACSASVEDLAKAGEKRHLQMIAALKGVAPEVERLQRDALRAAGAKPDNPQDLCGSLERYLRAQIKAERGTK